jgi:branched-chain amino acid transport system ATP-binding protein
MVAIGRALMSRPKLMLLDEPSMGLAPMIVEEIFEIIQRLNAQEGVSFLLAEQNAHLVLRYAHHGVVLENGRVAASGPAAELAREDVSDFYLGGAPVASSSQPAAGVQ